MTCRPVTAGGLPAIVCGRIPVKRCACSVEAGFLCDWKKGGGMTCDKPLCAEHATEVSPGKHLCPEHAKVWETHPANPKGIALEDGSREAEERKRRGMRP